MNILFRTDSSSQLGTGHIMRDLILAKRYSSKKNNIYFATQNLKGNIDHKILQEGYKLKNLNSNNFTELNLMIKKLQINFLVIDHYAINHQFEKKLKKNNKGLTILSFDDTYNRHYCDILLNHNIYAKKEKYSKLVPTRCKVKCGSKYTLLRDEFYKIRKKVKRNKEYKLLIAMGGSDNANLNIKILKILSKYKKISIDVVTTSANENLQALTEYLSHKKNIQLHLNTNNIAKLIQNASFGIITPSILANECYFLGLNFLAIKTAKNQKEMIKFLKKQNYPILEYYDKKKLKKILKNKLLSQSVQDKENI